MIPAAVILCLGAGAVMLWHMQKPRPPRIAVSFARFVPVLPTAPAGWSRISLTAPRDLAALLCLMLTAGLCLWAVMDSRRSYLAARPDHLGLRIVLDRSHSMSVEDGGSTRADRAFARLEEARNVLSASGAGSTCIELVGVAGSIQAPVMMQPQGATPAALAEVQPEGGDPALLLEAAARPQGECALTHVLVLTDQPQTGPGLSGERLLLWNQIGVPAGNNGVRAMAFAPTGFEQDGPEIRIEGVTSGLEPPARLRLDAPGGVQNLAVQADPDAEGRWFANAAWSGGGNYRASIAPGDGYDGDDLVEARLERKPGLRAEWRLGSMPRPGPMAEGGADAPLVTTRAALTQEELTRPLLITWPGFGAAALVRELGPFREDSALFSAVSFDALETALPAPWPGALPTDFVPVLTDAAGGVLAARRSEPFGLILPEPRPDLSEPARSLSLALFFAGLADLMILPSEPQPLRWLMPDGTEIPDAWRESLTGRELALPADLSVLAMTGSADENLPIWPWMVLAALALILAERALRLARRSGRVP